MQRLTEFLSEEEIPYEMVELGDTQVYRVQDPYEGEWFFLPGEERLFGVFAPPDEALLRAVAASDTPEKGG